MPADRAHPLIWLFLPIVFTLILSYCHHVFHGYFILKAKQQHTTNKTRRMTMENTRTQDYFSDDNDGHVDTREQNHRCENPDPHLGCDMGIDVAG
jgi:hypothetical protein